MEKQQGKMPQVRFPEFKDAWEHKKLSELLSEAKKRNEDLKYNKDEVLSVSGELGIVNQIEHLGRSYAGVSVHQYHVVEVGDIVYTKSPLKANPFGIIKLNKGKAGIVSTLYAVYKVNPQTAYGFFIDYYFSLDANTNRYLRPLVKKGAKNDMKINNAYVLHDRIFAPTIPEQTRIASFFTVLDKKIAQLKQKKSLLEQYKKGVMQKLFSQELRFNDENGKEFPKWEMKKLREVGEFKNGINKSNEDFGFGVPFVNLMDVFGKPTISDLMLDLVNANEKEVKLYELKKGDVLFIRSSVKKEGVGETSLVLEDLKNTVYSGFLIRFRDEKIKLDLNFKKYCFSVRKFREDLISFSTTSANTNINQESLNDLEISIPSIEEQAKIANFLSAIDEKINRTENQIQKTQEWKKGLLQRMFV